MPSKNRSSVAVRKQTKQRLDELAARLLLAVENGQSDIEFTEQGARGEWISADTLINRLIDHYEGHRTRSKRSARKRSNENHTNV